MKDKRNHSTDVKITFPTGASCSMVGERYDLICPTGLRRLAGRYALGAEKYDDYNWCKGIPKSVRVNHLIKHINDYLMNGNDRDDNLAAIAWNAFALMHYEEGCKHHEAAFLKGENESDVAQPSNAPAEPPPLEVIHNAPEVSESPIVLKAGDKIKFCEFCRRQYIVEANVHSMLCPACKDLALNGKLNCVGGKWVEWSETSMVPAEK